jgi:hypothetical protein
MLFVIAGLVAVGWVLLPLLQQTPLLKPPPGEPLPEVGRRYLTGLVFLALIFIFLPLSMWWSVRKRWQSIAELRVPRTYRVTEAGVEVTSETFSSSFSWDLIASGSRVGDQLALATRQNVFHLIPLADVGPIEQQEAFVDLIKRKVPRHRL